MSSISGRGTFATKFFGPFYQLLDHAGNAFFMAEKAVAQNIANANNPNYHPIHVEFEKELQKELRDKMPFLSFELTPEGKTQPLDGDLEVKLTGFDPEFTDDPSGYAPKIIQEKGKVDLNYEMSQLAQLQYRYGLVNNTFNPAWSRHALDILSK